MHPSSPSPTLVAALGPTVRARDEDISTQLRYLVRSAEPAVVFSSLAHLCVPAFSDACIIDVVEQGELSYRIANYRSDLDPAGVSFDALADRSVRTSFASTASGDHDVDYVGVMTHWWRSRQPTGADQTRAAVMARHGVTTVTEERRLGDILRGHDVVEQLFAARARRPLPSLTRLDRKGAGPGGIR